jgi:hypothetical protein
MFERKRKAMRNISLPYSATAATAAITALLGLTSCDPVQPTASCRVRPSKYAARYAVDGTPSGMCDGKILTGEVLNLNYFRDKVDYYEGAISVGITPDSVAAHLPEDPKDPVPSDTVFYSLGKFSTALPDDNQHICTAPSFDRETKVGSENISYKWSDFRVVVSPLSAAIYFGANLERKDGDCTAKYKVSAIYPATYCGDGKKTEKDPDTGMDHEVDDPTTGKADQTKCNSEQGSGLYPDIDYKCDATDDGKGSHLCLPVQDFPALNKKK